MKEKITAVLQKILKDINVENENIVIEIPKNKENGDYSSNIALKLAGKLNKKPADIANEIINKISEDWLEKVEIAGPGFINFYLKKDYLLENINTVISLNEKYGSNTLGQNKKVNIEFVSANPTGILHMGNARGGAYGDSLARIMSFCGYDVTKEYYLNDAGVQTDKLAKSIYSRYLTFCGIDNKFPEEGYPGKEIIDIAEIIFDEYQDKLVDNDLSFFKEKGVEFLTKQIFDDLKEYRINYDVITSEKSIYKKYPLERVIEELDNNGYIYKKDGATWFKSSELYDDMDHVLVKSDGTNTYLLPDIAYHKDKYERGFDYLIDVLGTDHHGYVSRLKSAIKALGYDDKALEVKLLQLVRIVEKGQVVTMHKRSGNIITLKNLIDEVGVNAARYFFSKSSLDTQMDFDIELAKSKTNDNPVYYVGYAYARICSILRKYPELKTAEEYTTIKEEPAYDLLACVYNFPEVVIMSCNKKMPHLITNYVYDLASLFHTYYEKCRVICDDEKQTIENLNLIKSVKITLFNALNLIGVEPDERM